MRWLIAGVILLGASPSISVAGEATGPRMLGRADPAFSVRSIPEGRLRRNLESLTPKAQARAISQMKDFEFPVEDIEDLHVDEGGAVHYVCAFGHEHALAAPEAAPAAESTPALLSDPVPVSPFPPSLAFHSRPSATNILYLDFDGQLVSGTAWNVNVGRGLIVARPFGTDTDDSTFSGTEQEMIRRIWERVAEDYAPFDVDVTTEEPPVIHNNVTRVVITHSTEADGDPMPYQTSGGVSYVGFFGKTQQHYYGPSWVYINNILFLESNIGEAAAHEAAHTFGLSHDGSSNFGTYYPGHGTNLTSWAPIMGKSYGKSVTQWSKGEYYNANNTQDDLAVLAGKLGYIPDDHGESITTATELVLESNVFIHATSPLTDPTNGVPWNKGIISPFEAADYWSFPCGDGEIDLTIAPWMSPGGTRGGNLDIKATLLDSNGAVVAESNPVDDTLATLQLSVTAGVYYIRIERTGMGSPQVFNPTGYTAYASIGQYFITGVVASAAEPAQPEPPALLTGVIDPAEAATQGGAWRILEESVTNWLASGALLTNITAGDYTITFKPVAGWTEPADQPITLAPGETGTVNGAYTAITTESYDIPVWWLLQNGFTNNPETAINETGANGMAAWESYIAGVDPNDPGSAFRLDVSEVEPGADIILRWNAVSGRVYSIYRMDEPGQAPQPVPGAQDLPWPRDTYTNQAAGEATGILQIRVRLAP